MTFAIQRIPGLDVYDLLFKDYLALLPPVQQDTMHRALSNSAYSWVCTDDDDHVVCTWGLIAPTILSDRAYLWMYTTKYLKEHEFLFIRHSQRALEEALRQYPIICGHVMIDNYKAIRWLRWLGAVFFDPINGAIPFEIRAKSWPPV